MIRKGPGHFRPHDLWGKFSNFKRKFYKSKEISYNMRIFEIEHISKESHDDIVDRGKGSSVG